MQRHFIPLATLAMCLAAGCGSPEDWVSEPDDTDVRSTFSAMEPGRRAVVCRTGGKGLLVRSGPGKQYRVVSYDLMEGDQVTILAAAGAWYETDAGGFSHGFYLCPDDEASGGGGTVETPVTPVTADTCSGSFAHPVPGYFATSEYGRSGTHDGIDIGVPLWTPIGAADDGVVEFVGWMNGYGYTVDVSHCGKFTTRYAHTSASNVKTGERVAKGQEIAQSGNTGMSTGPHLHFEIRIGGRWGTPVDPRGYIQF